MAGQHQVIDNQQFQLIVRILEPLPYGGARSLVAHAVEERRHGSYDWLRDDLKAGTLCLLDMGSAFPVIGLSNPPTAR